MTMPTRCGAYEKLLFRETLPRDLQGGGQIAVCCYNDCAIEVVFIGIGHNARPNVDVGLLFLVANLDRTATLAPPPLFLKVPITPDGQKYADPCSTSSTT